METTLGYEQVAVDLTAWLARHEPDPMLKQALDFALLEGFDHLYRYANLYDLLYGARLTPSPGTSPRSCLAGRPCSSTATPTTTSVPTSRPMPWTRYRGCMS